MTNETAVERLFAEALDRPHPSLRSDRDWRFYLHGALVEIRAALSPTPTGEVTAAVPCEGSVACSDHAVEGQKWCVFSGRWCRKAGSHACRVISPTENGSDAIREAALERALDAAVKELPIRWRRGEAQKHLEREDLRPIITAALKSSQETHTP